MRAFVALGFVLPYFNLFNHTSASVDGGPWYSSTSSPDLWNDKCTQTSAA